MRKQLTFLRRLAIPVAAMFATLAVFGASSAMAATSVPYHIDAGVGMYSADSATTCQVVSRNPIVSSPVNEYVWFRPVVARIVNGAWEYSYGGWVSEFVPMGNLYYYGNWTSSSNPEIWANTTYWFGNQIYWPALNVNITDWVGTISC